MCKLSICIPTFNRSECLRQCLESILLSVQPVEDLVEIIVSDNASTYQSASIVSEFQRTHPRIRYYKSQTNIGCERNIHKVATMAAADYIWIIGDDDKVAPQAVSVILEHISSGYDLIICNYSMYSSDFSALRAPKRFRSSEVRIFHDPNELMKCFGIQLGYISNLVMKRSVFLTTPLDEYESYAEYGFSVMLAVYRGMLPRCNAIYVPEALALNRTGNSGNCDWYKLFVVGTSLVFDALHKKGYSPSAILAGKHEAIRDYVIRDILVRKRDGQSTRGLFSTMYPRLKANWLFWLGCVPALLTPRFVVRMVDRLVFMPRREGLCKDVSS